MERRTDQTVLFILVENGRVLLEKRSPTSSFANHAIYPAGHVEQAELQNLEATLRRELLEELGITPLQFEPLPCPEVIYGETGQRLNPFVITLWEGTIPETILDKNNPVIWTDINSAANSPLESMRKLTSALKDYLAKR